MQRINICRDHANVAANEVRRQYGPYYFTKVMLNIAIYNACWYCENDVPKDDEIEEDY